MKNRTCDTKSWHEQIKVTVLGKTYLLSSQDTERHIVDTAVRMVEERVNKAREMHDIGYNTTDLAVTICLQLAVDFVNLRQELESYKDDVKDLNLLLERALPQLFLSKQ